MHKPSTDHAREFLASRPGTVRRHCIDRASRPLTPTAEKGRSGFRFEGRSCRPRWLGGAGAVGTVHLTDGGLHLTAWYKDWQPDASALLQPKARGLAFNAIFMRGDQVMRFVRAGASDGRVSDRAVSAGFGWRPKTQFSDLFGVGIGWVRPNDERVPEPFKREKRDFDTFHRFHLTPDFAIAPDLQDVRGPSITPGVDSMWVAELKARVAF